jgi:hypothetical protein
MSRPAKPRHGTAPAGIAWIPALVAAGRIEEAVRAGEYYKRFETWWGAPEDVDLAPTSEDGYAAVMAFAALEGWDAARHAADWMHTFRYTYDVSFWRATGDDYYLQTTRENLACFRQFVARRDGDFNAQRGMTTERYYQTDCFAAKGTLGTLSHAWTGGVLLYACEEALELGL